MKFRIFLILITALLVSKPAFSQKTQLPSHFESWNELQLILPLIHDKDAKGKTFDRLTATFSGVLRIGRKEPDFLDNRVGVTLDFRVNRFVSLTTGTLYRRDELVENVPRYETRFDAGIVFSKTWSKFTFRDRNMYERRFRNSRNNTNIYRNRFYVSHPVKKNEKELFTPFISEEGYYNIGQHIWIQNEFFAGITRKLNPKTSVDLAYVRNDLQPTNVNGFSFTLKIKLR